MKSILFRLTRLLIVLGLAGLATFLVSCTTTETDGTPDLRIYPTAAEKNQQMQEEMSSLDRTLL